QDLYRLPRQTARRIQEHFDAVPKDFVENPPQSAVEFASSKVFGRDSIKAGSELERNIEVLACADAVQEIEYIARRVKALLVDDCVLPDEITVVCRDLAEAAPTLRAVFSEFGIPARMLHDPPLANSAAAGFALTLLDALESWSHATVLDVLTSPWYCPEGAGPRKRAEAFPLLARIAQIIVGRDEWTRRMEALIERIGKRMGQDIERLLSAMPYAGEAAAALLAEVRRLGELSKLVPAQATPAAFATALDALIEHTGMPRALDMSALETVRDDERGALYALRALLGRMALWDDKHGLPESRAAFAARLRDALQQARYSLTGAASGVTCIDAASVRHLRFGHVFFACLNEGETPVPPPTNAVYSDADIEALGKAGIPIEDKRAHSARELLLFHHVLDVPRTCLCITWHGVSRRGQEKLPSPYVADLVELFPETFLAQPGPAAARFVPAPSEAASMRDWCNAALAAGIKANALPLCEQLRGPVQAIAPKCAIERTRQAATPYDAHDGVLSDPVLIQSLAKRFGDDHVFSVAQLDTYIACPFRFLVERLLGLDDTETPVAEFDPRVRGIILHEVLEAFHKRYHRVPTAMIPEEDARQAMAALAREQFDAKAWRSAAAPPGVLDVERRRIETLLERYLSIERERDDTQWKPDQFEVEFGQRGAEAQPFVLDTPAGAVRFAGRIDRIDRDNAHARIIDYKTSVHVNKGDVQEGRSLQLTVYALALEQMLL
ncbi:MAG TPA: hypothetical protein ENN80_00775, partial [Candidatus Hydrogenedentes bacterium]|nr:hypothetical protein [Candidatus Hydrogenedentota bacterium]